MGSTLGLIVNPVAGIGGPAGLKGSDGPGVQETARQRGSVPRAHDRAVAALRRIAAAMPELRILTASGPMGADAVSAAGLRATAVWNSSTPSSGADTSAASRAIADAGADLILFVGGDGTARDVCAVLEREAAILGVPAGVKMYSGCFATSPAAAGSLATAWLNGPRPALEDREVLDIDESRLRTGRADPALYGLVRVPVLVGRTQSRKSPSPASELALVRAAAARIAAEMRPGVTYLLGPGSTLEQVASHLGVGATPLGVDVVRDGRLLVSDASEKQLLEAVSAGPSKAVVTVIGGQGFLLGRGNQQFSASVLTAIGRDPLLVVATEAKLLALQGRPLLIETGCAALDSELSGYIQIVTGASTASVYPATAP